MARIHCKNFGQTADARPCDAFNKDALVCDSGDGSCAFATVVQSDDEVSAREAVGIPVELEEMKLSALGQIQISRVFQYQNDLSIPVDTALAIIDRMNPCGKNEQQLAAMYAYWDSHVYVDRDLGMLSALRTRISTNATVADTAVANAKTALKVVKAEKSLKIRNSFRVGLRTDRPTEDWVKSLVEADPEIKEAQREVHKAQRASDLLLSVKIDITEHINVLKKQLDHIRAEMISAGQGR